MSLTVPTYPNPQSPSAPWADAYAWIVGLTLDQLGGAAAIVANVHPTAADWQGTPARACVTTGEVLVPAVAADPAANPPVAAAPAVTFPTLAEFMAIPAFASAVATIQSQIEQALVAPAVAQALGIAGATINAT